MDVNQKVIEIIKSNTSVKNLKESDFKHLKIQQLGINSLNFIKIIVELENAFDIEFDDTQINYELMSDITRLVDLIEKMIQQKT